MLPRPATCRPVQALQVFGVSQATIYRWAEAGHITLHRRDGMTFVEVDQVLRFITGLGDQMGDQKRAS